MSCDILPGEKGLSHYHGRVEDIIHTRKWGGLIGFPDCTHLAVSGAKHFSLKRKDGRQKSAIEFFLMLASACDINAIENPVGIMSGDYVEKHYPELMPQMRAAGFPRKPTQIIQPWWFGDPHTKTTCLWLRGLPKLNATNIVDKGKRHITKGGKSLPEWYNLPPSQDRSKIRSRTFPGFAEAMATQWSHIFK